MVIMTLVVVFVVVFMLIFGMQNRAIGNIKVTKLRIFISKRQIQPANIVAVRQVVSVAVIHRLHLQAQFELRLQNILPRNGIVDNIDDTTDSAIGIQQRRGASNHLDLLDIIHINFVNMIRPQARHISDHNAIVQYLNATARHAPNNRLAHSGAIVTGR